MLLFDAFSHRTSTPPRPRWRRIEARRWNFIAASRPDRAESPRERLTCRIAATGKGKDLAALSHGKLRDQVRRRAEAIDSQSPSLACEPVGAIADQSRAQQRR